VSTMTVDDIREWRKAQRARLIEQREAVDPATRQQWSARMTALLERGFPDFSGCVVAICWPYRAEFDARFVARYWRERGAVTALPEVVAKGMPLCFRKWWPGAPTRAGVFDIPVPEGTEPVTPDVAVVPMNGFDERGYRLGYGAAFFDRTLASLAERPLAIGVTFELARLETIFPQPHDIPMDFVVTESGIYRAGGERLTLLKPEASAVEARALMAARKSVGAGVSAAADRGPEYSSPACYAHEVAPDYFGSSPAMPADEVIALLNTLLEAERAGAKVLAEYLNAFPRDSAAWRQLEKVQRDEATNCAILMDLIRRLHGTPSAATGEFLQKALAIGSTIERLKFLNRGQGWVARKIREALPDIREQDVHRALSQMYESHLLNIEACEALIETLAC
jgi:5-formyltetrahydrofolate cyclo-ligase